MTPSVFDKGMQSMGVVVPAKHFACNIRKRVGAIAINEDPGASRKDFDSYLIKTHASCRVLAGGVGLFWERSGGLTGFRHKIAACFIGRIS